MSSILGIFNRNGKNVEKKTIDTMMEAMSYWDPDEKDVWMDGSVALGHGMLWNTPESQYEHLPLKDKAYILTMDARIDNRDELAKEIELPTDRPLSEIGDSEFILGAYEKWGNDCPKHLLGDFAFALWDEKKKQLFCTRDHMGGKQLYYYVTDTIFIFSSDLKALMESLLIPRTILDTSVAEYYINGSIYNDEMTFFDNVKKLPPANTLIISMNQLKTQCYWKAEDSPKIDLPDIESYISQLRKLFERAVYDRMRTSYPLTAHLSGGLDSSPIAVLTARKLKLKGKKLLTFNWLHEPEKKDDPYHNEWYFSKLVAEKEGIEHHYVNLTSDDIYDSMSQKEIAYGEFSTFYYESSVQKAVQAKNSRTILSGWGGDEIVSYHVRSYYVDLLIHGKMKKLYEELKYIKRTKNMRLKQFLGFVYHKILMPLVPEKYFCNMPKIQCQDVIFSFMSSKFDPIVEKQMKEQPIFTGKINKTIRDDMLAYWNNGHIQSRREAFSASSISNKIEYSYPLLDKRLIEFILGVPGEYFVKNAEGRYLFKSAVKDLLPDEILQTNKIIEPKRIQRFLNELLKVYKKFFSDRTIELSMTTYIDMKKIATTIIRMNKQVLEEKEINQSLEIERALALILSRVLNKD